MLPEQAAAAFKVRYSSPPDFVVRAPGRVNLMGDHTDYCGGLVLPIAIDRALMVAARATDDPFIEVHSSHFDQTVRIPLDKIAAEPPEPWSPYIVGIIALLERQGAAPRGVQLWVGGDVAPGAGLASSAALEVGVALALLRRIENKRSPTAVATLCRQAEQEFAGSPCGIMDQLCCTSAKAGHALLIDCRSMVTRQIPLNLGNATLVVIDSGVRHSIAGAHYARRRRECAAALATVNAIDPSITSLRDITEDRIAACAEHLDDTLVRRVRHVAAENRRVMRAVETLKSGEVQTFGKLMTESHASLRDLFEVSCEETDEIVSIASHVAGVYGARMTGGGFGGCVIALTSTDAIAALESAMDKSYTGRFGARASVFAVQSTGAAGVAIECGRAVRAHSHDH